MKLLQIYRLFLACCVSIVSASSFRGAPNEMDETLERFGSEIASHAQSLLATSSTTAPQPPGTVRIVPAPAPSPAAIKTSTHIIQWGSAVNGCTYRLPNITVSCGAGATIRLGQKTAPVRACVSRSGSTLVCSSVIPPKTNPQVTVTCFGQTTAQLAVTARIEASQATCDSVRQILPQDKLIFRGGATSVFAYVSRYCRNRQNTLYIKSNYTNCGTGSKVVTQGSLRFCAADNSCIVRLFCNSSTPIQSCRGSCVDRLSAVATSDPDASTECINQGPRPQPLPASYHLVTWNTFQPRCSPYTKAVAVSCGQGGSLSLAVRGGGVLQCTQTSASSLSCIKNATSTSASIFFYCYGNTPTARTASAFLSKSNVTNCRNPQVTSFVNTASQALIMQRFCGNGTWIARPSRACGKASQLQLTKPNNFPICTSSNRCTSTIRSSCSIALDPVSISDPSADPLCVVRGPKSIFF